MQQQPSRSPGNGTALTVGDARRAWAKKFRASGIDSPELDARILVGHALGLDHAALAAAEARAARRRRRKPPSRRWRERRLAREPVARIVGWKEFWSLALRVDAATLVPRPETETVVEAALAAIDARGARAQTLRIADLGTGSGAILLALLSELPNAFGVGTDVSVRRAFASPATMPAALDWHARTSWPATWRRRCADHSTSSSPIRHTSRPARSRRSLPKCAILTRAAHSTADLMGSTSIGRLPRRRRPLLAPGGALVVELGSRPGTTLSPRSLPPRGLRHRRHAPILRTCRARWSPKGHERGALDPGKKALGMSRGTD